MLWRNRRIKPLTKNLKRQYYDRLKKGKVELSPHQSIWEKNAQDAITLLKILIGDIAIDIQHIGSTSIRGIHAKPIIDRKMESIEQMKQRRKTYYA